MADSGDSILAMVGRILAPVFAPLGLGDWRITTALIAGFSAKEAVVSTMAVLMGTTTAGLTAALGTIFTPQTAFVFLVFTLLYTPCIAAIATVKKELGGAKAAFFMVFFQTMVAWVTAFIVHILMGIGG